MPSSEQRDLRTLLRDRDQWVRMRTRSAAHVAGHRTQSRHATRPCTLECEGHGAHWKPYLCHPTPVKDEMSCSVCTRNCRRRIQELDQEVEAQTRQRPQARRLLTHPGVGPVTALATEVFLGDPSRFATANQVASYIGMIPCEHTSGKRQRLGKMTKQGNSLLRYLWTEATMHAVAKDPELKRFYRRKLIQKGMGKAQDRSRTQTGDPAVDHASGPD